MITISIQAGGRSSRIGRNKCLLPLGGIPLIEHVLNTVRNLGDEIIITSNQPEQLRYLNLPIISDEQPGAGSLEGLHTALGSASGDVVLVLACDLPFLSCALLQRQISLAEAADIVVPRKDSFFEPLHAIYRKEACLPALQHARSSGMKRVMSFWANLNIRTVEGEELEALDPRGLSFFNVNTLEDLDEAELLLLSIQE
ncbi:MAG: molybdenum cofactor guanylyltransferase [Anaerolineales bacterium]|nr:molybdenum cofactor guanylyltransferase [Anaerolineales bacterium]